MATRTIARLYATYEDAAAVVNELEAAGIPQGDISLVRQGTQPGEKAHVGDSGAGAGATVGTILGGGAGLLAGLGSIAIPGVGPIIAAGWLIATLTGAGVGAAAGGLLGALTGAGVDREEAAAYDEGVRRGGTLVSVRASDADAARIDEIMSRRSPVDWHGYSAGAFPARFGDARPVETAETSRPVGTPETPVETAATPRPVGTPETPVGTAATPRPVGTAETPVLDENRTRMG